MKSFIVSTATIILTFILFTGGYAYAASSLDELENQINQTMGYREELIDYVKKHNLTIPDVSLKGMPLSELEAFVKQHMIECKSGHPIDLFVGTR